MLIKCQKCMQVEQLCVCNVITPVMTATKVVVIMHFREFDKSSNTGRLVINGLQNSEIRIHGLKDVPLDTTDFHNDKYRKMFLFPRESAAELTPDMLTNDPRPVMLIIPDGNWKQASRMYTRIGRINKFECVKLPLGPPVEHEMRCNKSPERLNTFEAIVRAMEIIEGKHVRDQLNILHKTMITRLLFTRGLLKYTDVFGGIPGSNILHIKHTINDIIDTANQI